MDDLEHTSCVRPEGHRWETLTGYIAINAKILVLSRQNQDSPQRRVEDPIACLKACLKNPVKPTRLGLGLMGFQRSLSQRLKKPLTRKSGLSGAKGKRSGVT